MKVHEIPQDNIRTLAGEKKLLYALDENGCYTGATTTGWQVEETALIDILEDHDRKAEEARRRALKKQSSPIEYFMYLRRMDLITLAQAMGLFRWQVKRHLKPEVFRKLDASLLQQYADLFRVPLAALTRFEEES